MDLFQQALQMESFFQILNVLEFLPKNSFFSSNE